MSGLEHRFDRIDARRDSLEGHTSKRESKIDQHTWMLGLILLVLVVPQLVTFFSGPA